MDFNPRCSLPVVHDILIQYKLCRIHIYVKQPAKNQLRVPASIGQVQGSNRSKCHIQEYGYTYKKTSTY